MVTKTLFREQEAVDYASNSSKSAKLQRNYNYSHLWMDLVVNYKAKSTATFKYLHFANLIKSFLITGNGSTEFKNIVFAQLFYQTYLYCGGKLPFGIPKIASNADSDGDGGQTLTYKMRLLVPFASLTMYKPSDTGLNGNLFQTLDYMVNWADEASVGTDITIISAQLKPVSWERIETQAEGEVLSNSRLIQRIQTEQITSSASGITFNLPPNKVYNDIHFDCIGGASGNAVVGGIKRIKFLNGTDVVTQVDFDMLQVENQRRYGLNDELFCKIYATEIEKNQTLNPRAHGTLNFSAVGHYMASMGLKQWNQPQIVIDVTLPNGVNALAVRMCQNFVE